MAATRPLSEILPKEMTELKVRPLFTLLLDVAPPINVGKAPGVDRRIGVITGGRFEGEKLRGTLLPGGSDWQAVRPGDGAFMLNVRICLKTDDDAIISMSYPGIRHGPKEVLDRIARGEVVKATTCAPRACASFTPIWPSPPMPTMPTFLPGPAPQCFSGDQVVIPAHKSGAAAAKSLSVWVMASTKCWSTVMEAE